MTDLRAIALARVLVSAELRAIVVIVLAVHGLALALGGGSMFAEHWWKPALALAAFFALRSLALLLDGVRPAESRAVAMDGRWKEAGATGAGLVSATALMVWGGAVADRHAVTPQGDGMAPMAEKEAGEVSIAPSASLIAVGIEDLDNEGTSSETELDAIQVEDNFGVVCPPGETLREGECVARCPATMAFVAGGRIGREIVGDLCFDRSEVTVQAYTRCVKRGRCPPFDLAKRHTQPDCNFAHEDRGRHPINCVTLAQARAYCRTVGKRLPSEREWEWAAQGGKEDRKYPWGDEDPSCERAVMIDGGTGCGTRHTWPVGSKPLGSSRDGLVDMSGNVWEWTSTLKRGERAVICGGSWHDDSRELLRSTCLYLAETDEASRTLGFRCVRRPANSSL